MTNASVSTPPDSARKFEFLRSIVTAKVGPGRGIVSALILLLYSFAFLGANPFQSETLSPSHILSTHQGWDGYDFEVPAPRSLERSDILDVKLPIWIEARELILAGEEWSSIWSRNGGISTLDFTQSIFTPSFAVFLAVPDQSLGWYLGLLLQTFFGAFGFYLLARKLGVRDWVALLTSMSFISSGFFVAWLYWHHVSTAIWIPWLVLATYNLFQRGARRGTAIAGVFGSSLMLILGGFPVVAAFGFYVSFSLAIFLVVTFGIKGQLSNFITYLAGMASAFLVSAPALLPFLRRAESIDLSYRAGGSTISPEKLVSQLFFPMSSQTVEQSIFAGPHLILAAVLLLVLIGRAGNYSLTLGVERFFLAWGVLGILYMVDVANLLSYLPGLGSSLFNRGSVLVAFSLSLTSAMIVERFIQNAIIRPIILKRILVFSLIPISIFGLNNSLTSMRFFNAPTPSSQFFPAPPILGSFASNEMFEYTLPDNSFGLNGTLTHFGINDWFSHGFELQETGVSEVLLSLAAKPYSSRTSAAIDLSTMNWDSPFFDLLGVRYVVTGTIGNEIVYEERQEGELIALRLESDSVFSQDLQINTLAQVTGIEILLATYGREFFDGDVELSINDSDGLITGKAVIPRGSVRDNARAMFEFDGLWIPPGEYELELRTRFSSLSQPLAIWQKQSGKSELQGMDGKETFERSAIFRVHSIKDPVGWRSSSFSGKGLVFENLGSPNGPYLVRDLNSLQVIESLKDYQSSIMGGAHELPRFEVPDNWSGYLVLPIRKSTEWSLIVDGVSRQNYEFAGLMPAVKVFGGELVELKKNSNVLDLLPLTLGITILLATPLTVQRLSRSPKLET